MTTPESALVRLATSVRPDTSALEQILDGQLDWTQVVQATLRHRLVPGLLHLLEMAEHRCPPDILTALRHHHQQAASVSDMLASRLADLVDALAARGVTVVPFKGPALASRLFGHHAARCPGDLDLLARRDDVSTICEVLEKNGFVDAARAPGAPELTTSQHRIYRLVQCEHLYVRESDGTIVEPHWALSQRALAVDVDYAAMLDRAHPCVVHGRAMLALAPADLLLALCVHGAKHHWERLAWVRDVAALLHGEPAVDLEGCLDEAGRAGCRRIVLLGLSLARTCAGATLPPAIVEAIAADKMVAELEAEVLDHLFSESWVLPANDRVSPFRLRMRERWLDRVRYVTRTWLLPRREHIEMVALPASLAWGYVPLKVGVDYVARPIWHVLKAAGRQELRKES